MNGNSLFSIGSSNFMDPYNGRGSSSVLNSYSNYNIDTSNPIDIFSSGNGKTRNLSPSTSPHTNSSSSSSQSVFCGHCDNNAINRCLDCNDVFCAECFTEHTMNAFTKQHTVVGLGKITPIGSVTSSLHMMHSSNIHSSNEPQCDIHGEALRFLCETCKIIVCQECTLKDHKDHFQTPIANITSEKAKEKLKAIHESSKLGIKFIKTSIDRAVTYSQSIERDSLEMSSRVKKAFRLLILAAEDRERTLLEQVDKYRQQKVANLSDQMTGLRAALAGLAETSECVAKSVESIDNMPRIDVAFLLANTESQIEKYAAAYKNLQPKEESLSFLPPNFELLQEIRNQGEIVINCRNNASFQQNSNSNGSNLAQSLSPTTSLIHRQPIRVANSPNNGEPLWDSTAESPSSASSNNSSHVTSAKTYASIVRPAVVNAVVGQCIPGSTSHISVKPAIAPSKTFVCFLFYHVD